jgi:hypothetical protein
MASDTTKITLRDEYFSLPNGPIKLQVASDFARLFGQTPEESLRQDQAISLRSTNAASGISFVDPTQFNAGTGLFDQTRRGVDASVGGAVNPDLGTRVGDVTGGRGNIQITDTAPPSTVTRNNEPQCDYRYSFGCPEFSRRPGEAGCRVLLPIYRTCFQRPNLLSAGVNSFSFAPELMGYIDISTYAQSVNEVDSNFVQNGVTGTRTINGTRLTAENLRLAIQDLGSYATSQGFLPKFVDRPDLGEGVIGSVSGTAPRGGTAALREFSQFDMTAIARNLQSVTTVAPPGFPTPVGNIDEVADYWAKRCDFSKQPDYCFTSVTFRPNPTERTTGPRPPSGPFIDRSNRVEIPGTRKPTGETEKRLVSTPGVTDTPQKHPNKPCILAIARLYDDVQLWEVQYGYAVYANSDFTGAIISYVPDGGPEQYPVSRGTYTEYTNETIDPNCGYKEIVNEYEEDDPSDKCFGIVKKDVSRMYEDGRIEQVLRGAFVRYYRKQDADCAPETIKVYHPLDLGKDVISAKVRAKTKGLFDGAQTIECFHTSSTQKSSSKSHYYEITDCDTCGKKPYFAVAYGHNQGSGSVWAEGELNDTPTRAVYSQYRLLSLDLPDTEFTFYTNGIPTSSKDVYVINFSRTGMSDRIDPGNWELDMAELRGGSYANNVFTGSNVAVSSSNKVLTFIDDSGDRSDTISCTHDPYVSYDVISGSLTYGVYSTQTKHTYGIVYPNLGIIVLDPYKMNTELGFNTVTGSNIAGDNAFKLFTSISGSGVLGSYMKARNVKYKTTNHYFVRVAAPLGNYSNNPTYVSGSDGMFFHPCFDLNPQTYITTVGLYNDFNELLAVAKLSQPINKSFDNDVLIKIRLNW